MMLPPHPMSHHTTSVHPTSPHPTSFRPSFLYPSTLHHTPSHFPFTPPLFTPQSLPITSMAMASGRPDKFVGLHFFNPVQLMKLLEVIRTDHTSEGAFQAVSAFGQRIGKTTVSAKDTPGFIVNRLLVPYLMQAMAMVDRKGEA